MANIVILGAGVMGSALAAVASNNNDVTLIGSPLDDEIVNALENGHAHPTLTLSIPETIKPLYFNQINGEVLQNADVIIIGVSSPGIDWALSVIEKHNALPNIIALVTKGLVASTDTNLPPSTYAQTISQKLTKPHGRIVGIGGPCIAHELALSYPTRVAFASDDLTVANELRALLETDYYHINTFADFTGLEACAALKNFMCIGVSAMFTAHTLNDGYAKNPLAGLFNQALDEINTLCNWIKQHAERNPNDHANVAFGLAGLGDLHVTVGGGRNSKLGKYLGTGRTLADILESEMSGVTVEGVDTGKQLLSGFAHACDNGTLQAETLPLTQAILNTIETKQTFNFEFSSIPR